MTPLTDTELHEIRTRGLRPASRAPESEQAPALVWPIVLTLPWSALCSDNQKSRASLRNGKPIIELTDHYKRCKGLTHDAARKLLGFPYPEPAAVPLRVVAQVYVPDNRIHDAANFSKCCFDGLEGTIYTKDRWLHDVRWFIAAVDVDQPRAVLTFYQLATAFL